MQNQSAMGMGAPMNPNVPGAMGGMFPGSTPMDILQLQQNMQMQQMMQQQQKKWSLCILTPFSKNQPEELFNCYYEEISLRKRTNKRRWNVHPGSRRKKGGKVGRNLIEILGADLIYSVPLKIIN